MKRVYYNKLVRDGIKDKITQKGEVCEVRIIEDDTEFEQELLKKITEEATALTRSRSREEFLDEYADLMTVLDTLINQLAISESDIKVAIDDNVKRKGKYTLRHFLHWSEDSDYKSNETPQGINN